MSVSSMNKFNNVIKELNEFTELEMKEIINSDINNIFKQYNNKIDSTKSEISQLDQEIINLNTEISNLSKINDSNLDFIKKYSKKNSAIDKNGNIFSVLQTKSIELDTLKMSIVKEITELESLNNSLTYKLNKLKQEREEKSDKDKVVTDEFIIEDQDLVVMKINLNRNIGVRLETLKKGDDEDVLILTDLENKSDLFKVDSKLSDYFISNYIWDKLG
ncbi:unnamed protein product [Candida verbasci]|uniref:Kinetochore protein Spc24 n=1 Tax=Candida verbasci TaxID=1227364 RepID=A0A9W4TW06_9ASCO|nr:unnamed protein product [Candida verbasci]